MMGARNFAKATELHTMTTVKEKNHFHILRLKMPMSFMPTAIMNIGMTKDERPKFSVMKK